MSSAEHKSFDLAARWEEMVDRWFWIVDQFGMPGELARAKTIARKLHEDILLWLQSLEHCARRLIFLEALALLQTGFVPRPKRGGARAKGKNRPSKRNCSAEDSRDWRVSFAMAPRHKTRSRGKPAQPIIKGYRRAEPLAARIEAVRRAIKFHGAFAQRFATRLARKADIAARAFAPFKIPTVDPQRFFFEPIDDEARHAQEMFLRAAQGADLTWADSS